MKKYTFEELVALDGKELHELRLKMWDVKDILRAQDNNDSFFNAYDISRFIESGAKAATLIGAAYIGYRAVKYYTDKKFPSQEVNR